MCCSSYSATYYLLLSCCFFTFKTVAHRGGLSSSGSGDSCLSKSSLAEPLQRCVAQDRGHDIHDVSLLPLGLCLLLKWPCAVDWTLQSSCYCYYYYYCTTTTAATTAATAAATTAAAATAAATTTTTTTTTATTNTTAAASAAAASITY